MYFKHELSKFLLVYQVIRAFKIQLQIIYEHLLKFIFHTFYLKLTHKTNFIKVNLSLLKKCLETQNSYILLGL